MITASSHQSWFLRPPIVIMIRHNRPPRVLDIMSIPIRYRLEKQVFYPSFGR